MYKTEIEKQLDLLLGEAILALLDEKSLITNGLLLKKLHFFLDTEVREDREEAINRAIAVVMASESTYSNIFNRTNDELTGTMSTKKSRLH